MNDGAATTDTAGTGPAGAPAAAYCTACGASLVAGACGPCASKRAAALAAPPMARGSIRPALSLYFVLLGINIAGALALILAGGEETSPAWRVGVLGVLAGLMSVAVVVWAVRCREDLAGGLRRRGEARWYAAAAAIAPVTCLVAEVVVGAASRALDVEETTYSGDFLAAGLGWGAVVLLIAVQPAVIEELAFRGVIQGSLGRALRSGEALVVAAMLFTILHLMPLSFPHLLLIGLAAGWLRARSGSLYPAMLLHFLHNGLVVAMEWRATWTG